MTNNLQIRIQNLQPDAMDVGVNLDEAINYLLFQQELYAKLKVFIILSQLKFQPINKNSFYT